MQEQPYKSPPDKFDRVIGMLTGLPDVTKSAAVTIIDATPILGDTQTFIVQTHRQREVGDWIAVQFIDAAGGQRLVIPPAVAAAIARQREAISSRLRREHGRTIGKRVAAERKARGEPPPFMKGKKSKKRKGPAGPSPAPQES